MKFENKVVVITGGTRGIGKELTKSFLKEGAKVYATYTSNDEAAEKFKIEMDSSNLELRKFDVSASSEVEAFYSNLESEEGRLDILVNNSGIRRDGIAATMSDEDWERVIQVNLTGSFNMARKAVKVMMRNRFGRIINMSSVGGELGLPGQLNYAASKAGQMAMAKSLSKEVGKKGITVNCVAPGFIETEMTADLPEDQVKEYKKQIPLRRFGKAGEVANAVMFLASEEAAYITGTTLKISGGL